MGKACRLLVNIALASAWKRHEGSSRTYKMGTVGCDQRNIRSVAFTRLIWHSQEQEVTEVKEEKANAPGRFWIQNVRRISGRWHVRHDTIEQMGLLRLLRKNIGEDFMAIVECNR